MAPGKGRRALLPLDQHTMEEMALRYTARYATTRAKLSFYLARKIRERGWKGELGPDPQALARRFAELGYVDDAAFALNRAQALAARGYGKRRLLQKLHAAGIEEEDGRAAVDHADEQAVAAAVRFARRRRIGPFAAAGHSDPRERERALAAMVRAGHRFALARAIASLAPGAEIDLEDLARRAQLTAM